MALEESGNRLSRQEFLPEFLPKNPHCCGFKRRGGDSNSRNLAVNRFSKPARSAAPPPLQRVGNPIRRSAKRQSPTPVRSYWTCWFLPLAPMHHFSRSLP